MTSSSSTSLSTTSLLRNARSLALYLTSVTVFQALVLGIIQGLSEFLPISSSAHLALAPWILHWPDPGLAFDVALHFGTLVAVLWYFRAQWISLLVAAKNVVAHRRAETEEERRVIFLIIATIPGAIAGLALESYAESAFRDPRLIAVVLIVMGIVLWLVDKAAAQERPLESMRWTDALMIGLAQMFAILPGVSRSGSTITAGRALRLTREGAAVFSFLMSMPIIAAASILKVPHVLKTEGFSAPLVVGVLASAISGWLAITILLRFVVRRSYGVFAAYRVVVGLIVLAIAYSR
jgi:undecaprenyl-diphosphatase